MGMWMWSMDNSFVRGESNDDTNRCTLPYAMLCNNHNFNKLSLSAACLDKGPFTTIRYAMQQCTRVAEKCHLICLHCCISVQATVGRRDRLALHSYIGGKESSGQALDSKSWMEQFDLFFTWKAEGGGCYFCDSDECQWLSSRVIILSGVY